MTMMMMSSRKRLSALIKPVQFKHNDNDNLILMMIMVRMMTNDQ